MSALSQPVLQLDCLTKRYPGVLALDRFSIALDRVADAVTAGRAITTGAVALRLAVPPHAGFTIEAKSGDEA